MPEVSPGVFRACNLSLFLGRKNRDPWLERFYFLFLLEYYTVSRTRDYNGSILPTLNAKEPVQPEQLVGSERRRWCIYVYILAAPIFSEFLSTSCARLTRTFDQVVSALAGNLQQFA